ncbi:MAG: glycoside hydrolase family 15 protein, partial [Bacteroidota bacterium]
QCYVESKKGYAQAIGVERMDASTLQLIMMSYLNGDTDRAKHHLAAMEAELSASNGLFYRYKHQDDFGEPETTFLICAFWYVEALACVGRVDEAIKYFENLLSYSNHVGLLSEDVDDKTGSMWGNFPQAYSHVGLINAGNRIANKLDQPNFL